jgi:hypothetical protein
MTISVTEIWMTIAALCLLSVVAVLRLIDALSSAPLVTVRTQAPVLARCFAPYLLVRRECTEYLVVTKGTQWWELALLLLASLLVAVSLRKRSRTMAIVATLIGAVANFRSSIALLFLSLALILMGVGVLKILSVPKNSSTSSTRRFRTRE